MQTFIAILKSIAGFLFALIAPFLLVVVGVLIFAFGVHKEWQWVANGGIVLAVLGILWIVRYLWLDD